MTGGDEHRRLEGDRSDRVGAKQMLGCSCIKHTQMWCVFRMSSIGLSMGLMWATDLKTGLKG